MPAPKVCPKCNRDNESDARVCSHCDFVFPPGSLPCPDPAAGPGTSSGIPGPANPVPLFGGILLETQPDPRSFLYKYVMATVPVLLVILSIFVRALLGGITSTLIPGIPDAFDTFVPTVTSIATISIYLVAPVGIFVVVAGIGWALRFTELWAGTALTLGLSVIVGMIMLAGTGTPVVSEWYVSHLVQWIAYLVQPFCIVAVAVILLWTEKFRRSITYTITTENIGIRGGVWKHQEHLMPHHQIARVVLEQDLIGRMFNYGTVIPQSITRWGAETSIRGVGAGGQKNNLGAMIGYAKGREEASRYPLDCFFGIPDPHTAQQLMNQLMIRPATREEEQVAYLKEICDKI